MRNPNAPSPAELQHPAWSEFNIAKDAYARGQKLLQLQDRAVKMLLEFSGREEEFLPAPLRRVSSAREEDLPPVRRASNVREEEFQTPLRRISSAQEDPSPDPELVRALPVARQTSSSKKKPPLRRHSVGERRRMGADDPGDELTASMGDAGDLRNRLPLEPTQVLNRLPFHQSQAAGKCPKLLEVGAGQQSL